MAPKPSLTPIPTPPVPSVPQAVVPSYGGATTTAKLAPPKKTNRSILGQAAHLSNYLNPVHDAALLMNKAASYLPKHGVYAALAGNEKELAAAVEGVPKGLVTLVGGLGIDAGEAVLDALTFGKYHADMGTTMHVVTGIPKTVGSFLTGKREIEYFNNIKDGKPIVSMLLEDAGNLLFFFQAMRAISVGAKGGALAAGEAATLTKITGATKTAEGAVGLATSDLKYGGGLAGKIGEKAAAATESGSVAAAARYAKVQEGLLTFGRASEKGVHYSGKMMQVPFTPYVSLVRKTMGAYRSGSLFGKELGLWGQSAVNKYIGQLSDYREQNPNANPNDPKVTELRDKIEKHMNSSYSVAAKRQARNAAKRAEYESQSVRKELIRLKTDPTYRDEINLETGEKWGPFSDVEGEAVIAAITPHGQLINYLTKTLGIPPEQLAVMGGFDQTSEHHLSPAGAKMAVDFVSHTAENPTMSEQQYARLQRATETLAIKSYESTQNAISGFGRKHPLSPEYVVPTPFVKNLYRNLKQWGNKEALKLFDSFAEAGVWELPIDNKQRMDALLVLVELMPDEYALDASMYPASMREILAFYKRLRIRLGRELIGDAEGNPLPPVDQPPVGPDVYPMTPKTGKLTAAADLFSKTRQKIENIARNIDQINERIKKIDELHTRTVDKLKRHDIVDLHLDGMDVKKLAKKYNMTVVDVQKILNKSDVVKQFKIVQEIQLRISELEKTIGKKRSGMSEVEATVELGKMQAELVTLRAAETEANAALDAANNVNEVVRRVEENTADRVADDKNQAAEDLFDAEDAFIAAGGDPSYFDVPDDVFDPMTSPLTVGSGRTYYEGLTQYLDEVLAPQAKQISPAMEADVARIKVIIAESWLSAERNYYESATEAAAAVNQARVIQLGELMRDLAINASTPGHMIENTIRNRANLDILSGVTSPFERPSPARKAPWEKKPLFIEGEELPFQAIPMDKISSGINKETPADKSHVYDSSHVVTLDPDVSFSGQLLKIADSVEVPEVQKWKQFRSDLNKDVTNRSAPTVVVSYAEMGYPASFEISHQVSYQSPYPVEQLWISLNYKSEFIHVYTRVRSDMRPQATKPSEMIAAFDKHLTEWEAYKADPLNAPDPFVDNIDNGSMMPGIRMDFEYPELPAGTKQLTQKDVDVWLKKAAKYDLELQKFNQFLDELVGPRTVPQRVGSIEPLSKLQPIEEINATRKEAAAKEKAAAKDLEVRKKKQRVWKDRVVKEYEAGVATSVTASTKSITDSTITSFAKKAGETIETKTLEGRLFLDETKNLLKEAIQVATGVQARIVSGINAINNSPQRGYPSPAEVVIEFKKEARDLEKKIKEQTARAKKASRSGTNPNTQVATENSVKLIYEAELTRINEVIAKIESAADNTLAGGPTNSRYFQDRSPALSPVPEKAPTPQDALLTNTTAGMNERADYAIIPCSASKLDVAAPAAELYTGSMFKDALATARKLFSDDKIFIMSAKHGLVSLDTVLEPYDLQINEPGSVKWNDISVQLRDLGIDGKVLSLLPKNYQAVLARSLEGFGKGAPSRPFNIQLENLYEGSKGIGEQKGRLSQLRQEAEAAAGDPAPRIEDAVGAIELSPEFETRAKEAAANPELLDKLRNDHEDVLALDRDIKAVSNPTPEDIKAYREQQLKFYNDDIYTQVGFAQNNLGAGVDLRTGNPTWGISPKKGQPEWDWWFGRLDAKQRQIIARDFFRTTEFKSGAFGGPRYVRKGTAIDAYADEANMTVDEFGAAILENIDRIQKARRNIRNTKATEDAILGDEFSKINLDELNAYKDRYDLTSDEYAAVIDRANHLNGAAAEIRSVDLLRPIVERPAEVVEDLRIDDPAIRQAVYEADVIRAMARDASAKMKKAERMTDRIAAFEQWIKDSEKYKVEATELLNRRQKIQEIRFKQINREEKLRNLKNLKSSEQAKLRRTKALEARLSASEPNRQLGLLPGGLPLRLAMDPNIHYPSSGFDVEYLNSEGVLDSASMVGPMYLPSGGKMELTGGVKKTFSREGTQGNSWLRSEHYRRGDRETIFSIRLLAIQMGTEAGLTHMNAAYRAIVATFGKSVKEVFDAVSAGSGEEPIYVKLRAEAEAEALAYSRNAAETLYESYVKEMDEAGTPVVDGRGAYSAGLPNPQAMLKLMVDKIYGEKLVSLMADRGLQAVDPFSKVDAPMAVSRVNEETMFVPNRLQERIMRRDITPPDNFLAGVLKKAHWATSRFKTSTLVFSTTWQLGDLITNAIISQMSGVDVPTLIKRMNEVKAEEYGPGTRTLWDPTAEMPTTGKLGEFLQSAPVQDLSLAQQERLVELGIPEQAPKAPRLERVGKRFDKNLQYPEAVRGKNAYKVSFKVNETINRIQRHAYFLELMDRRINEVFEGKKTLENIIDDGSWKTDPQIRELMFEVADTANKWLGDFADLTMRERAYMTPLFPFYAWIKHIHKVFWALANEHPQTLAWYFYLGNLAYDPNEDPMNLRFGGTRAMGGLFSTNFINPLSDVVNGPAAYFSTGDTKYLLQGQGVVTRQISKQLFGLDPVTLKPITRAPGSGNYSDSGVGLTSGLIVGGLLNNEISASFGSLIQDIPMAKRLAAILPGKNIPGTRIALGPVSTYGTGEARLSPQTNQRLNKWGGTPAAIARFFSLPGIPYQTDKQISSVEKAARARLKTVETLKKRRANSNAP
jgi:hypothetical protein